MTVLEKVKSHKVFVKDLTGESTKDANVQAALRSLSSELEAEAKARDELRKDATGDAPVHKLFRQWTDHRIENVQRRIRELLGGVEPETDEKTVAETPNTATKEKLSALEKDIHDREEKINVLEKCELDYKKEGGVSGKTILKCNKAFDGLSAQGGLRAKKIHDQLADLDKRKKLLEDQKNAVHEESKTPRKEETSDGPPEPEVLPVADMAAKNDVLALDTTAVTRAYMQHPMEAWNAANAYAKKRWNAWNVGGRKGTEPLRGTIPMIAVLEALAKDGKVVLLQHFRVDDAHDTKRTLAYSDEVNPMSETSVKSLEEGTEKVEGVRRSRGTGMRTCDSGSGWETGGSIAPAPDFAEPVGDRGDDRRANDRGKVALTKDTYGPLVSTWDEACFPENTMVANEEELMDEVDEDLTEVKNDRTSSATNTNGASTALADDDNSNEASTTSFMFGDLLRIEDLVSSSDEDESD